MLEIVLYEPEIPPNAGNIMRLCANSGCRLHLVGPLGFSLANKRFERAAMDYRAGVDLLVHDDWPSCRAALAGRRIYAVSTKGADRYDQPRFARGDVFLFGAETRGLPADILAAAHARLRLPMRPQSRSMNLANAVAVMIYEAWRQFDFEGAA